MGAVEGGQAGEGRAVAVGGRADGDGGGGDGGHCAVLSCLSTLNIGDASHNFK
jgi:hypothetical protein